MFDAFAEATTAAAESGTRTSTVSKKRSCTTATPAARRPDASADACSCTRRAMARNPSAP